MELLALQSAQAKLSDMSRLVQSITAPSTTTTTSMLLDASATSGMRGGGGVVPPPAPLNASSSMGLFEAPEPSLDRIANANANASSSNLPMEQTFSRASETLNNLSVMQQSRREEDADVSVRSGFHDDHWRSKYGGDGGSRDGFATSTSTSVFAQ